MVYLGIDVGSVSVKAARLSEDGVLLASIYRRHCGKPLEAAVRLIEEQLSGPEPVASIAFTGTGGKKIAELLEAPFENEIICQTRGAGLLTPLARSVIAIGGEDSYLIILDPGGDADNPQIKDFAMNGICAAGAGSFLDQQASRLGIDIEGEFGDMAMTSARPARVAGRCSVFAKSDMIHLQQKATSVEDIVAGLCFAFARNFVAVLARGKDFTAPVVFQGGVAQNAGMVRAFREILGLDESSFQVSENAATAGAVGAAALARRLGGREGAVDLSALRMYMAAAPTLGPANPRLPDPGPPPPSRVCNIPEGAPVDAYLGVDVGSISTNVVVMDSNKNVISKSYLMTAGRPIEAVRKGLEIAAERLADKVVIRGVCTTGSGRYLTGDFLGADLVKNEITAQARAAAEIDPSVDTIFEIGGQDSKYISLEHGAIVDFEMNKVCAAGTGSFLEEQAERLGISIKGEFADLAMSSSTPVQLGERCTVFMESDLVEQQQRGASTPDLCGGLAYSTVYNYLNRVVGEHKIGEHIFFQGGTAFNRAVVAAFMQVTGKPITVPEHHEVTGAIGCCLMAMENAKQGVPSAFRGWDLSSVAYRQESFECKACSNACEINRVIVEGQQPLVYGGRCEKYEKKKVDVSHIPDLFTEREEAMVAEYREGAKTQNKPLIGIPRALHFADYAPYWIAFFNELDVPIKLSSPTNKHIIREGLESVLAEYCFPVKVAHGHVAELLDAGVTHIFLPCIKHLPKLHAGYEESVQCPYVSSLPYTIRAALDPEARGVGLLAPIVDLSEQSRKAAKQLHKQLDGLGVTLDQVAAAVKAGSRAQRAFASAMSRRGKEITDGLSPSDRAVVIFSRGYNGCDSGINLDLPTRFRELGTLPIPLDMLPMEETDLSEELKQLSWRSGHKIMTGAAIVSSDPRLRAVYITNFGCGPDSFLLKFFRAKLGGESFLQIEIDEHSADAGALTRCEAFIDSFEKSGGNNGSTMHFRTDEILRDNSRVLYVPNMCDQAHAIAAAFRSVDVPSEVLPPSDAQTLVVGKKYCTGKECFPCIVTTGDLVKLLQRPDIDPNKVAFFMPSVSGSAGCRFRCYSILHRLVLDDLGYESVPVFSPNQDDGFYESLGKRAGGDFVRRAWRGLVASEMLEKALHHVRPHESIPGRADAVYHECHDKLIKAVETNDDVMKVMEESRAAFESIPTAADGRPWVGIIGEVFVRSNDFSRQQLVERIEELGGKVWLSPLSEWVGYTNYRMVIERRREGRWADWLRASIYDRVMRKDEHQISNVWNGFLPNAHEISSEELVEMGKTYIDPEFGGEPILSLGKAAHLYNSGLSGVINVMPFTCMLGTFTSGILKRFQQDHNGMPILNLAFDGQGVGDLPVRLEAFIEQCRAHKAKAGK